MSDYVYVVLLFNPPSPATPPKLTHTPHSSIPHPYAHAHAHAPHPHPLHALSPKPYEPQRRKA